MTSTSNSSLPGRLWLAGMGLVLALAGSLFTWVLWTAWQRAEETRRWVETPCRIISSQVVSDRPTPHSNLTYKAEVRYSFTFQEQSHTGQKVKRVDSASQHEDNARKKLEEFPVGKETVCFVNPAQPNQTVLKHDSRAPLYSIWFPLLFVVGGLGMAWNALKRR
jgi:hypothetical protein